MSGSKVDLKIVLLGQHGSGKTSLAERYLSDRFSGLPYQATIGAAFGARSITVAGKVMVLNIWDTAGSERYESMSRIYYRGAWAAIVCYDLTNLNGLERARFWMEELVKNEETCRIYLCGTKKDLVSGAGDLKREAEYLANEKNAQIFETSSKTGENINNLFYKIAHDFQQHSALRKDEIDNDRLYLHEEKRFTKEKAWRRCCSR